MLNSTIVTYIIGYVITISMFVLLVFTDALIRTHYYKYFHPKECHICDSNINPVLVKDMKESDNTNFDLLYPFGCTLIVNKPSVTAFTSGTTTFPVDRPLGALYYNQNTGE